MSSINGTGSTGTSALTDQTPYQLDAQIGFVLRRAFQRHTAIFQEQMTAGLTPTQFAALARLYDSGPCSQNQLGRLTAMDIATIKGVVDRLKSRGFITVESDTVDRRRRSLALSGAGYQLIKQAVPLARQITRSTLAPLSEPEQQQLLKLLTKIA